MAGMSVEMPTIAAIVVTFHSGPALKECLYALCVDPHVSEIVIVNNGNDPDVVDWLLKFRCAGNNRRYEVITGHGNVGFATAVNLGAKRAQSDCLLIINPDAVLRPGSTAPLEAARQTGRSPCLVGGKLFYMSGKEQRGGRRELLTLSRALWSFTGLSKLENIIPAFRDVHREKDPEPDGPVPMPVVSGALCYISVEDFRKVEGFDELYFLHVEDIDFCRRIGEAGGEVVYTPLGGALHYGSTSDVSASFVQWHKAKGLSYYFQKYAGSAVERHLARASLYFFAVILVGRSTAIRIFWQTRRAMLLAWWKLTRG